VRPAGKDTGAPTPGEQISQVAKFGDPGPFREVPTAATPRGTFNRVNRAISRQKAQYRAGNDFFEINIADRIGVCLFLVVADGESS
jgi:hypothetical protein